VDSTVAFTLCTRALGPDRVRGVYVDTGLMREGETDFVRRMGNLSVEHAEDQFLTALAGVTDPERKRHIIGEEFVRVQQRILEGESYLDGHWILGQGTIYPDTIESGGSAKADLIKTHHNRVAGIQRLIEEGRIIEPLASFYKDEVRAIGRELGLPPALLDRHPFPGPGLAIRVPGEITREKLEALRKADTIYLDEIRKAGLYDEIWQAFAVLLPVKTVGVMGDDRTYDHVCALRAVTSTDGMTADYYPFEHSFLAAVSTRIVNEVRGINRVVYDVTSKPPGTIEWE
jgi:GMP synthase (glutamine-hydrolysing)